MNKFRKIQSLPFLLLTLLIMLALTLFGRPLITNVAPLGIISYEFAGNVDQVTKLFDSWNENDKIVAALSLGLDFLFIFLYTPMIAMACVWSGEIFGDWSLFLANLGVPLAWGVLLAGLLDLVENIGLLILLIGGVMNPWPTITAWSATLKFLFIALGLTYSAIGVIVCVYKRISSQGGKNVSQ